MSHLSSAGSSNSFSGFRDRTDGTTFVDVEMFASSAAGNIGGWGGVNLEDNFLEDVEEIKDDLKDVERLCKQLQQSHEESKTLNNVKYVKELRLHMDDDVSATLKKVKLIKVRLEAVERDNSANYSLPAGRGPSYCSDHNRSSVVSGVRKKLKDSMDGFSRLREQISGEYRETMERRYSTMTREKLDDQTLAKLISKGYSETFLPKATDRKEREKIRETIWEIQERHDAMKEMERSLEELHQVFLPMVVVLEEQQGEGFDQVNRAGNSGDGMSQQLLTTSKKKRNIWKWISIGAVGFILFFVAFLMIGIFVPDTPSPHSAPSPVP